MSKTNIQKTYRVELQCSKCGWKLECYRTAQSLEAIRSGKRQYVCPSCKISREPEAKKVGPVPQRHRPAAIYPE